MGADEAARSVVTIGAYDGVHLGHREVIGEVLKVARARALRSVVVTFDRHPAAIVRPESAPLLITDLDQKVRLLRAEGIDEVLVIPFDAERSHETAEHFVSSVLAERLHAAVVIVGADFHFGHARAGNVALLRQMGETLGFEVIGFDLVGESAASDPVSSTRIRALISAGDVVAATALLGRAHEVCGMVVGIGMVVGDGTGHDCTLEVPSTIAVPAPGAYEVLVADCPDGEVAVEGGWPGRAVVLDKGGADALVNVSVPGDVAVRLGSRLRVSFVRGSVTQQARVSDEAVPADERRG